MDTKDLSGSEEFIQYLPEVYRDNDFLRRYLYLFQGIYLGIESTIDGIAVNFDPESANLDFVEWLAKWVNIKYANLWGEKRLRELVKRSYSLHKKQGTRGGIEEIVKLLTGKKPHIIEPHMLDGCEFEPLLKPDDYSFIMLVSQAEVPDEEHYRSLVRIVNDFKPAHTDLILIVLKPHILLGHHHYLGINSAIGGREIGSEDCIGWNNFEG